MFDRLEIAGSTSVVIGSTTGKDGKKMLIIGLSRGNIEALQKGMPIYKPAGEPLPFHLTVVYGETEQAIVDQLATVQRKDEPGPDPDPGGN